MGKKKIRKRIRSLEERIREHEAKIIAERRRFRPNDDVLRHWEAEIHTFHDIISRARKRLGERL